MSNDVKWASLLTKPEKVSDFSDVDLIYYHGVVAQEYLNNSSMLPKGYKASIQQLYYAINQELLGRLTENRNYYEDYAKEA